MILLLKEIAVLLTLVYCVLQVMNLSPFPHLLVVLIGSACTKRRTTVFSYTSSHFSQSE